MKCTNCGADVADGFAFCTSCGTPITAPATPAESDKTVLIDSSNAGAQPMNNPFGQNVPPQPMQFNQQPQTGYTAQPMTGQPQMGYTQQPMNPQPQMGYTQQPMTGQPHMGYTLQSMNAQPQMGYTQPQGMYNQAPYGQPQGMYNQPPKPPKKPLSPGAKKGIIIGLIVAALAALFIFVILPIITRAKLDGEYTNRDSYYRYKLVFDDGTYAYYDEDGYITEAGTYEIDDEEVTLTNLSGYETEGKFDAKENKIRINGDNYKSSDEDAELKIALTENYLEDLEDRVETITETLLADEEIYEEFSWSYYFIYEDDLEDPYSLYEEALAEELDYANDETLQELITSGYLTMDIYMDGDDIYIDVSAY